MRIGIDFDNTIVSYDALFHKVAREQGAVPPETPLNKLAVRDYLRAAGQEDRWTEMQGYVYGVRMVEAVGYEGALDFIRQATNAGHRVAIISHKTRHPFLGPAYDLHAAAGAWIERNLLSDGKPILSGNEVFFELTKQEKLARISSFGCDVFIDDLPEILLAADFPSGTARLLFDPEDHHSGPATDELRRFRSWREISEHVSG